MRFAGRIARDNSFRGDSSILYGNVDSAAEERDTRPRFGGEDGQFQGQFQACFVTGLLTTGGTDVSELG